jgi:hypothetical protein
VVEAVMRSPMAAPCRYLRKVVELLFHQESRCTIGQLDADHARVRTVRSAEGVVHCGF